jgi:chemotaxis protein CheD
MLLVVGVGDLAIERAPRHLVTYALGSCICVTAYDPVARVGGLVHALLPEGAADPKRAAERPPLFADLGIDMLLKGLVGLGAQLPRLRLALCGGAALIGAPNIFDIGKRNILAAKKQLWIHRVPLAAEETGGGASRSVRLDLNTGAVVVTSPGKPEKVLS